MIKYDPNNPLSEEELDKLGKENFDTFLEYLDSKADYLKQFTKPLGTYHTKRFAAATAAQQGKQLTKEEFDTAQRIGKEGEIETQQRIIDKMEELGLEEPDKNVKNVKTHRSQWFE
jgi:thiaminase